MIDTLDQLPGPIALDADICIIGAGAAGLLMAREFLATGLEVVILEGGGWTATDDGQDLFDGEVDGDGFRGLQAGRSREFGGATTLWGGQCIQLDPIDFEQRAWVPFSGWPVSHATLAPFYRLAQSRLGIAPDAFEAGLWQRFGLETFDFAPTMLDNLHSVFIRRPDLGQRYRAELGAARNIRVLLHANVTSVGTNAYGAAVSHVEFRSAGGKTGRVNARRVVLCAGGIENARLLLLSDNTHSNGLGNDQDLVGRYLQDHPCGRTAVISTDYPRRLQDHYNLLYGRKAKYLPKMVLSDIAQRRTRSLNCVGRLAYEFDPSSGIQATRDILADLRQRRWPTRMFGKMARIARSTPALAKDAARLIRKGLSPAPRPARIYLETFSEQTPDPQSRVLLSNKLDRLGLRQVKIDWRLDTLTGHTLRTFTEIVGMEFERLGLGTLKPAEWLSDPAPRYPNVLDSYHPAGTTRMAESASQGVVDTDCQVFGVHGLYVAGSSVFPTSGAANPTLSIAALALRLAHHIEGDLARPSFPATQPALTTSGVHQR